MKMIPLVAAALALCSMLMAEPTTQPAERTTASGLKITEVASEPLTAAAGDTVWVHYSGFLQTTGAKFDSSLDRHDPIKFTLGAGQVIKGWDEGITGMKVGDKRTLIIPSNLAYGERGAGGGAIPPNATLLFQVQLVGIDRGN